MNTITPGYTKFRTDPPTGLRGVTVGQPSPEEVLAEIERLNSIGSFESGNTLGACGATQLHVLLAVSASVCVVFDQDQVAGLGFEAIGYGGYIAAAEAGLLVSNAPKYGKLLGSSVCVGASLGIKYAGGVDLCLGISGLYFNGIWAILGSGGIGVGKDVHIYYGTTTLIFSWDVPCIGGWKLPSLSLEGPKFPFGGPKLPSIDVGGPTLPSLGCG